MIVHNKACGYERIDIVLSHELQGMITPKIDMILS